MVNTKYQVYTAVPGSDLFSWHPTLMTIGFSLLMAQAIVIFSPVSSLLQVSIVIIIIIIIIITPTLMIISFALPYGSSNCHIFPGELLVTGVCVFHGLALYFESGCHNLQLVLISKFSQNFVLETRMLCFSRHSRQKCRKSRFLEQNSCF